MQKLEGDGMVFIHAGRNVEGNQIEQREILHLDTGCKWYGNKIDFGT